MTTRTKFIYDETGTPIGRVDEDYNVYTLNGNVSHSHYHTRAGAAVNKSHQARVTASLEVEFEEA